MLPSAKLNLGADPDTLRPVIASIYAFAYIWSIGAALDEGAWSGFDDLVREKFPDRGVHIPGGGDVHDYFVALPSSELRPWKDMVAEFDARLLIGY